MTTDSDIDAAMDNRREASRQGAADSLWPTYHLCPSVYWSGDVNGPIWHNGYYHLFYQHWQEYSGDPTSICWAHARSPDLVHWEHLPTAILPSTELGEKHCASGCTVINGRGQPMIFYSSFAENRSPQEYCSQWGAIGDDELIKWKKHPESPLLDDSLHGDLKVWDWRDPFIFRDQGQTYMILGGNLNTHQGGEAVVNLYAATDEELTNWEYLGVLFKHPDPAVENIECPNFLRLGDKWVLVLSLHKGAKRPVEYFTGTFDTQNHVFDPEYRGMVDYGSNRCVYYATNALLDRLGRQILWGRVGGLTSQNKQISCISLPRILGLRPDGGLSQTPAPEIDTLRYDHSSIPGIELRDACHRVSESIGASLQIRVTFEPQEGGTFGLRICSLHDATPDVTVSYDGSRLDVAGIRAPFRLKDGEETITLQVFLDRSVAEVYASNSVCCANVVPVVAGAGDARLEIFASGPKTKVKSLDTWRMKSIFKGH